jgi:hypothetical protein
MQTGIRVIKRGAQSGRRDHSANPVAKSDSERERETVQLGLGAGLLIGTIESARCKTRPTCSSVQ